MRAALLMATPCIKLLGGGRGGHKQVVTLPGNRGTGKVTPKVGTMTERMAASGAETTEWEAIDLGQPLRSTWLSPSRALGGLWRLHVRGLVEQPLSIRLKKIERLGMRSQEVQLTCVHGWTTPRLTFLGVPLASVIKLCAPDSDWEWLHLSASDGSLSPSVCLSRA